MTNPAQHDRANSLVGRFQNRSLRMQVLVLLFAIFAPMSFMIGMGVYHFISANEKVTWQVRQKEAAIYARTVVDDFIVRLLDYLNLVGSVDQRVHQQNANLLNNYLDQNLAVMELIRVDKSGQMIGTAYRDQPFLSNLFTLPQSQWFREAKSGRSYVGGFQIAAQGEPYLIAAAPSSDGGAVAALIRMNILWDVVKQIRFGETGNAYVITPDGGIIAHQNLDLVSAFMSLREHPELMKPITNIGVPSDEYKNLAGESVLSISELIPTANWIVVTELQTGEAQATSRIALALLSGGIILLGIIMMAITYRALYALVLAPLERMRAGAILIGTGDLDYRINLGFENEIGQLANEFDTMVAELQQRNVELFRTTDELAAEILEHKETQVELRVLNNTLEERIFARTQDLELLNTELTRSNRELQEFAYVASHDLQEPLRKIRAFGDRLAEKYADALDERGKDYIVRMQNSAQRMQSLIDALLTYSRVTTKEQPFAPTDLNQVAQDVIADLDLRLRESSGSVIVNELAKVTADPTQMRLLLQNLLSNALKFHSPDRPPVVVIEGNWVNGHGKNNGQSPSADVYRFTVKDNGIGFEPGYAERIFQVFQRLHGRGEYEGTGVGLAICRKIVERHGGNIVATAIPGEGAVFTVTLPAEHSTNGKG